MKKILIAMMFFASLGVMPLSVNAEDKETENQKPAKIRILFLCTGNSCRSQMAEGWAKTLHGDKLEVYSAGITTHGLNPNAVKVMQEAGVDISGQKSENIKDYENVPLDYVITVCPNANETYPEYLKKAKVIHKPFPDPPKQAKEIAEKGGSEAEQLECYRVVRDEIKEYVNSLLESLK